MTDTPPYSWEAGCDYQLCESVEALAEYDDELLRRYLDRRELPVEVIKFAQSLVTKRIAGLGAEVKLRRQTDGKPFLTDENNHILCGWDCPLLGAMHDGRSRDATVFLRHKDGQRVPVSVRRGVRMDHSCVTAPSGARPVSRLSSR